MRIVSLLPSATEIVFALGLGEHLVGVSHTCDFPEEARRLPVLTRSLRQEALRQGRSVAEAVAEARTKGGPMYLMEGDLLRSLRPDLILTQEICDVCAVDSGSVFEVAGKALDYSPTILSLNAATLEDVLGNVVEIGRAAGAELRADGLAGAMRERLGRVAQAVARAEARPGVAAVEWARPLRNAGLWVPELIAVAGGRDSLGTPGERSRVLSWSEMVGAEPDVVLMMPCGMDLNAAAAEAFQLQRFSQWWSMPAASHGQVFALDGRVPSRHGPRLVDVAETVAALLHPELGLAPSPRAAWRKVG